MVPGMDGSPANEKPQRQWPCQRRSASFTGGFSRKCRQDETLTHFPACSGCRDPHCTCCSGICCRRCTTTPSAWGFLLSSTPLSASSASVSHRHRPPRFSLPCWPGTRAGAGAGPACHATAAQSSCPAPSPTPEKPPWSCAWGKAVFTASNMLHSGQSCSQIPPERYQKPQVQLRHHCCPVG